MSPRPLGTGGPATCPCGTGIAYAGCCGALHAGDRWAATAEELMRSRYAAFAVGDAPYLVRTWHPRTRPEEVALDPATCWTGLTVVRTVRGGTDDEDGVVEFVATWAEPSARRGRAPRLGELREVSRFARRAGRWLYVDGDHA